MRRPAVFGLVAILAFGGDVLVAAPERPLREVTSSNERYELRIERGRPGRRGAACRATLYHREDKARRGRPIWDKPLVNDIAPQRAFVRNDGRYVVTLGEYRRGGARHTLVIYGQRGELLRHFLLQDLLDGDDWTHVRMQERAIRWLDEAECRFVDGRDVFELHLNWGRTVHIDLRRLQIVDEHGLALRGNSDAIPADVIAALWAHADDAGDATISDRLRELAELSPDEDAQSDEVAQSLRTDAGDDAAIDFSSDEQIADSDELAAAVDTDTTDEAEPDTVAASEPAVADEQPSEIAAQVPDASADVVAEEPQPTVDEPVDLEAPEAAAAGELPVDETVADDVVSNLAVQPPMPDPANPVDYLAWANEFGRVEGPDAAPVYNEAIAQFEKWPGESTVFWQAIEGDEEALASPEVQQWLDANADAIQSFRLASRYPARSWQFDSEDGSLIGVTLPHLSPMRDLARATVADGRRRLLEGRPDEAAVRYLDAIAAGAHTSGELTLISDLVGTAMQQPASDALLDLAAHPTSDELDFAELAAELEAAYPPSPPPAETVQGERAFFLDTAQRIWTVDEATGEPRPDMDKAFELAEKVGMSSPENREKMERAITSVDYEDTIAAATAHYDALTRAMQQPYGEAQQRLRQLESRLEAPDANPLLATMAPSLSRYHMIKTRSEASRRGTMLVTGLRAYRQEYGEYPESLDSFADMDYATDPFSGDRFVYWREGDSFVLYSVGHNGVDDNGKHDRRGDVNDVRFWPRPE